MVEWTRFWAEASVVVYEVRHDLIETVLALSRPLCSEDRGPRVIRSSCDSELWRYSATPSSPAISFLSQPLHTIDILYDDTVGIRDHLRPILQYRHDHYGSPRIFGPLNDAPLAFAGHRHVHLDRDRASLKHSMSRRWRFPTGRRSSPGKQGRTMTMRLKK